MKKALLPVLVGSILTGCGSDSDSHSSTPDLRSVTALFMDSAAVEGVDYDCDNTGDQGSTSALGQFSVSEGAICKFTLDGYYLGTNREGITHESNQVTAYALEDAERVSSRSGSNRSVVLTQEQYASNISALLQSVDASPEDQNSLDTTKVVGQSLKDLPDDPLKATTDEQFNAAVMLVEIEQEDGTTKPIKDIPDMDVKDPSGAKDALTEQYTSENVQAIIDDLEIILGGDLTTIDVQSKLSEYRSLLGADDGSNGYHQKALDAILEIAEVLNMPEVADRITVTGSNYSEMLAMVLDSMINPEVIIEFIETPTGTTDDVSRVLTDAAKRLENASARLGAAMPGEGYTLPYSEHEEDEVTYQDTLVIRTGALVVASTLYTASSYNAGDDSHYLLTKEVFKDVEVVVEKQDWSNGREISWEEATIELEVEHATVDSDPIAYIQSPELLTFRSGAASLLTSAKSALNDAVNISQLIILEEYLEEQDIVDAEKLISELANHLDGSSSHITIDNTYADLHAFYSVDKGIDRSDIEIVHASYLCDLNGYEGSAEYSEKLSQISYQPTCSHNADYVDRNIDGTPYGTNYDLVLPLYSIQTENSNEFVFIPAVPAEMDVEIAESGSSNIIDVVWCGVDDEENKVSCLEEE